MNFQNYKYEAENGQIHPIRLSDETFQAVSSSQPDGAVTSQIRVKLSKNKGEAGISPRGVNISRIIEFQDGEIDRSLTLTAFLPILSISAKDDEDFQPNASVVYKDETWKVQGFVAEDY